MADRRGQKPVWITLAERFPATLAKNGPPELLEDGQTPDAYGLGIDRPGALYAASIPTGTARPTWALNTPTTDHTAHNLTVGNCTWREIFRRPWATITAGSPDVYYFAPYHFTDLYLQGFGKLACDADTGNVVGIIPFGNNILAMKANHSYVIPNGISMQGNFVVGDVVHGFGASNMTDVTVHGGVVYAAHSNGVFAFDGQNVRNLTQAIRQNLGNFTDAHLDGSANNSGYIIDEKRFRLVGNDGTKKWVIDLSSERPGLYDYTTSGFLWTSRTFVSRNLEPFCFTRLGFFIEHTDTSKGTLTYQIKHEQSWSQAESIDLPYLRERYTRQEFPVRIPLASRRWAMKITALSSNLRINAILGYGNTDSIWGFGE